MNDDLARPRQRIGPWRLLDIVTATMPLRSGSFASGAIAPEYGPPDAPVRFDEPFTELPGFKPPSQRTAASRPPPMQKQALDDSPTADIHLTDDR